MGGNIQPTTRFTNRLLINLPTMSQLQFIRDKFKSRDLIEVDEDFQTKVLAWITNGLADGQDDVRKTCQELSRNGFIKFIKKGVLVIKTKDINKNIRFYPFEFTDDGKLLMSIYIKNPMPRDEDNPLELLCKITVGTDTRYIVIEGSYNEELAATHIGEEFNMNNIGVSHLLPIIQEVNKEFPDLKPDGKEWRMEVGLEYFRTIIKAQIINIIGVHAYLSLLEKEILISRITQEREMKAGLSGGKKNKRNPFYRYVVTLPPNYIPRKFDINYVVSQWQRPRHTRGVWVRAENAEKLQERSGGVILWDTLTTEGLVKIRRPFEPQTCHRRIGNPTEKQGTKIYSN
jgi:hypothetical protein